MSAATGVNSFPGGPKRAVKSIGRKVRSAANPLCISALIERANARAPGSAGHKDGSRSAKYSAIASESQIRSSPASSTGTLPLGECRRIRAAVSAWRSGISSSLNAIPVCRSSSHGRSDHEEPFLLPMTSVSPCMRLD